MFQRYIFPKVAEEFTSEIMTQCRTIKAFIQYSVSNIGLQQERVHCWYWQKKGQFCLVAAFKVVKFALCFSLEWKSLQEVFLKNKLCCSVECGEQSYKVAKPLASVFEASQIHFPALFNQIQCGGFLVLSVYCSSFSKRKNQMSVSYIPGQCTSFWTQEKLEWYLLKWKSFCTVFQFWNTTFLKKCSVN